MVDWSQCPVVESDPERVHGAWVFKSTRLPIAIVFECLARGATIGEIIEWYGGITKAQIEQVVSFKADSLQGPRDAARINTHEDYEVRYWSEKFGVTVEQLKAAVAKVGVMSKHVEAELKKG